MTDPRPWEVGSHEARWDGYLLGPGSTVLRNKVGATTSDDLRAAENDLLEFRLTQLRSQPELVPRTYDLTHLRRLHFQLFQDVYEWAGDLDADGLVLEVTYLYDYLNFAHPFREGNGRTQREFFAQLLAESGRGIEWDAISMSDLHAACHQARTVGDVNELRAVISAALNDQPVY